MSGRMRTRGAVAAEAGTALCSELCQKENAQAASRAARAEPQGTYMRRIALDLPIVVPREPQCAKMNKFSAKIEQILFLPAKLYCLLKARFTRGRTVLLLEVIRVIQLSSV
jgi:hypothetical protein